MTSSDLTRTADTILEQALEATGARDPREFYRARLKELREADAEGYQNAVRYYRETLIPIVAGGDTPALDAWTEYGRRLAVALAPGQTVSIDETGLSHPFEGPMSDRLVLHMPEQKGGRALVVALPVSLSPAQRATYDVLVDRKQKVRPEE